MSLTRVTFVYNGGPQVFPTNFALGVLETDHVYVAIDGNVDGEGNQLFSNFNYDIATGDVTITDTLTVGDTGVIFRQVPINELIVDFEQGEDVTRRNLSRSSKQVLMAVQEVKDQSDADNKRLDNFFEDVVDNVVDTVEDLTQTAVNAAQDAQDARDSAGGFASAAETSSLVAQSAYQGRQYVTRAEFVADDTYAPDAGTVATAGGLQYVRSAGATVLPGLAGWLPFGDVYPDHFAENTIPGTTDMTAAFQAALDAYQVINLRPAVYRINDVVTISQNGRTINGDTRSFVRFFGNSAGIWVRNSGDITAPGTVGPSSTTIKNMILQRISGNGPTVRLTRSIGVSFSNIRFWGGCPDVLQEGAMNTDYNDCSNTPTADYSAARKTACFEFRWWQYSDGSVIRGFTTNVRNGTYTSSISDSYRYNSTFLITASDQTKFYGTYFGSSLIDVLVRPDSALANIGSLHFEGVFFDDGGADVRYKNICVSATTPDTGGGIVRTMYFKDCNFFGNRRFVNMVAGESGGVDGAALDGCVLLRAGGRSINARGNASTKPAVSIVGGTIDGWGFETVDTNRHAIYAQDAGPITISGVKVINNGPSAERFIGAIGVGNTDVSIGGATSFTDITRSNLIQNEGNLGSYVVGSGVIFVGNSDENNAGFFGVGGSGRAPLITDFTIPLRSGIYRYEEHVAVNAPGTGGTFEGSVTISKNNTGDTAFAIRRSLGLPAVFVGSRTGSSGSFTWAQLQLV